SCISGRSKGPIIMLHLHSHTRERLGLLFLRRRTVEAAPGLQHGVKAAVLVRLQGRGKRDATRTDKPSVRVPSLFQLLFRLFGSKSRRGHFCRYSHTNPVRSSFMNSVRCW